MKSQDAASIAALLTSEQDSALELALLLLEQYPVHQEVLVELLFARLCMNNETLITAFDNCLKEHAPNLSYTLHQYQMIVRNLSELNDHWLGLLYRRLADEAHFGGVNSLAVLVYQRLGRGLEFLSEKLSAVQLIQLLQPCWNADLGRLNLSDRDFRQFPYSLVVLFPDVQYLDLSQNVWLRVLTPDDLSPFTALQTLDLQGSAWTDDQRQGIAALHAAFPDLQIIE